MWAQDRTDRIDLALRASGLDQANERGDMDQLELALRSPADARCVELRQVLGNTGGAWHR